MIKLAEEHGLEWPLPDSLTNEDLQQIFYPGKCVHKGRKLPDYEYIFNEPAKPGVPLTLLWSEYCAQCNAEGLLPYQHTQFNAKYHAFVSAKKVTLRIKRKSGAIMEVDLVGDILTVHDQALGMGRIATVSVPTIVPDKPAGTGSSTNAVVYSDENVPLFRRNPI